MDYRFCLDEVMKMIAEALNAGYHYASIYVHTPDDEEDESGEGAFFTINADDDGGICGWDYETIDSVPFSEVQEYAYCGKAPAPQRPNLKVKIKDRREGKHE